MRAVLAFALLLLAATPAPAAAQAPPGANDPDCTPAAAHPFPVILVHGTFGDMSGSWSSLAPALRSRGFCVWALNYGRRGTGPIDESASELSDFILAVLATTGAAKVSLVGHSQGGMLARYTAVRRGRLRVVDDIVGLAPASHGTTSPLARLAGVFGCRACAELKAGSAFMRTVNQPPPEAPDPAWYTVVSTRRDKVVTPYRSQALAGPRATNVILQDRCPAVRTGHVGIISDPVAIQWTVNALERPGAANPRFVPDCRGASYGRDPDDPRPGAGGAPPAAGPSLRVTLGSRARGVQHRRAGIRVGCRGPRGTICAGRLELRRTRPGRRYGATHFRLRAGSTRTVRISLSRSGARTLARRHRLNVRARALLPLPGGEVAVTSRRYTLR
jgi:pimeloyl-ACP methyl ester carboxylesterase